MKLGKVLLAGAVVVGVGVACAIVVERIREADENENFEVLKGKLSKVLEELRTGGFKEGCNCDDCDDEDDDDDFNIEIADDFDEHCDD